MRPNSAWDGAAGGGLGSLKAAGWSAAGRGGSGRGGGVIPAAECRRWRWACGVQAAGGEKCSSRGRRLFRSQRLNEDCCQAAVELHGRPSWLRTPGIGRQLA